MHTEIDPEVIADLQLRAATERDSSRTRSPVGYSGADMPEPVIAQWQCRYPGCETMCDITQTAIDVLAQFNGPAYLVVREYRPIKESAVMICDEHRKVAEAYRAEKMETKRHELAKAIQELKRSKDPRGEKDCLEKIRKLGHPDVGGLLQALDDKQKLGRHTPKGNV